MTPLDAILLGMLEGLTELLPVSSTGHLILLSSALGHEGDAAKSFDVVIQLGAVLAVAVFFRLKLRALALGIVRRDKSSLELAGALAAGFVPTAALGVLLHDIVKAALFGPTAVAGALIAGGVVMIAVEHGPLARTDLGREGLEHVGIGKGFIIGLCQCLSLWPGASRSMTTIVGGQLMGLSTKTAAEFSFLLALPTLGAATLYDLLDNGRAIVALPSGSMALALGMAVSFLVAWAVVALFLRYVTRVGMTPFGIYRLLLGAAVLLWA